MSMNWLEQEELQAEYNARHDYLSEAYGREARMLADQARDEQAMDEVLGSGFLTFAGLEAGISEQHEKLRAAEAIRKSHTPVPAEEDVPF